jgi:hypothetical protein
LSLSLFHSYCEQKQVKTNQLKATNSTKAASGLKISFRPAELSQTTDRNVRAQILGVLSKDPSLRNKGNVGFSFDEWL